MEHWQKILIGTFGGLFSTFIFYFVFGKLFDYFYLTRKRKFSEVSNAAPVPQVFRSKTSPKKMNPELERFIHEEFESSEHEVVVVVGVSGSTMSGICAFLHNMNVEYFVETIPACCLQQLNTNHSEAEAEFEVHLRSCLAAVSVWSPHWLMADGVNLLSGNQRFVIESNQSDSNTFKFLKPFEEKFDFRFFIQWMDNFVCDHVANEEMWEGLIFCLKKLLRKDDPESVWSDFVCEQWDRKRIRLTSVHFHQLPHPGQVMENEKSPPGSPIEGKLVEF